MLPRHTLESFVALACVALACTEPSPPAEAKTKPKVEAKAPTPADDDDAREQPVASDEGGEAEVEPELAKPDLCGVTEPRAADAAYARACVYLGTAGEAERAAAESGLTPPEGIPSDWQAIRSDAGLLFAPPDWVVVREGDTLMAVAPGTPEQASGHSCSLSEALPAIQTDIDSAVKIAREELEGLSDGEAKVTKATLRGIETARLRYVVMGDSFLERLYATAEGVRKISCHDASQRGFEGVVEVVDKIVDSYQRAGATTDALPVAPCEAVDSFVAFPGPVDFVNADLAPLINTPGAGPSVALAELLYYTQCTYWATLLPLDGGPRAEAVIVGYERIDARDGEFAPARIRLETRADPRIGRAPEPGRPASIPTDVVVIEPANPEAALLPTEAPAGLELEAPSELVAVVSLSGPAGPPEIVFVRELRDQQMCLLQYRSHGPSTWTVHTNSCKLVVPTQPEPAEPNPGPKLER
ncbi:hypothetical protein [Enhygromyxa salina]|uniref:Uncharacterized protein n=1 Tax=Enhygromyxa salina TaxID=215803 RepID=A0A2S9XNM3_9BACT|nr:hypothetical protein [Enhygromyxa salina]PRP94452.1 hypothetical protein ENSA7_77860 [Enhygromyxa salina]